jgi:hypothetical protein
MHRVPAVNCIRSLRLLQWSACRGPGIALAHGALVYPRKGVTIVAQESQPSTGDVYPIHGERAATHKPVSRLSGYVRPAQTAQQFLRTVSSFELEETM